MGNRSSKIIVTISALILLVSLGVSGFALYLVANQKDTYATRSADLAEKKSHEEALKALTQTLHDTESERASLFSRILADDKVVDFLGSVESLGHDQGVELKTMSLTVEPIDKDKNQVFETLVINLEATGSYDAVMHVLALFEHIPYQAEVDNAHITKQGDDSHANWKGEFQLRVTKFKKT